MKVKEMTKQCPNFGKEDIEIQTELKIIKNSNRFIQCLRLIQRKLKKT